jgi:hypothetical protein
MVRGSPGNFWTDAWQCSLVTASSKDIDDGRQDDGTEQCDQHGRNGDGIIDRADVQAGAEEVTSQENGLQHSPII